MKYLLYSVLSLLLFLNPMLVGAGTFEERISGHILLDVENFGEAWYVYPGTGRRFYLGRPQDAFDIMRFLGLGITNADLDKIPTSNDDFEGDMALRERLSGYILLQVEENGEAWYVYPGDLKRYYLGRPADAFQLMSDLGLGISEGDLANVPTSQEFVTSGAYQSFNLGTSRGSFHIDVVTLDRNEYDLITDTAEPSDCESGCNAKPLADFLSDNSASFGLHGTYFCPPDYTGCGVSNTFLSPVFNSSQDKMINADALPFHSGPMLVVGTNGTYYWYHRTIDFG